ncbi:MAG TPA: NusG domain II-containing protein [Ignavibacteria bacterium]|nr:NusG domain II-containing protein [Ignavibacteria bacterium]
MKRRDFFKKSSIAISAAALSGIPGISFSKPAANPVYNTQNFSLEIITDRPDKAVKLSEEFLKNYYKENTIIKFSEYPITGNSFGDIVFVRNGKLINFKEGSDDLKKDIRIIAGSLSLPKKLINPSRIRFYLSGNKAPAERILVFHKNVLIRSINTGGRDAVINLNGSKGNLILNIESNKARVLESSCTHKTCINSGSIAFSGESIVCIPNELMILCE